jgi:hypothetical protein
MPPATSTLPSGSKAAGKQYRASAIGSPVGVHAPVRGLQISADCRGVDGAWPPPATSTLPLGSRVAACSWRAPPARREHHGGPAEAGDLDRAVIISLRDDDTELFKQFMDNEAFRRWLSESVFRLTYRPAAA